MLFYLPFDGLASLYVVSALFGLERGADPLVMGRSLSLRESRDAGEGKQPRFD